MDNIILDLVSNVNVLPKKTWETMRKPNLILSPIQLRFMNQHNNVSIGRLLGVNVNIDGVHSIANFKLIEIVDGNKPYPTLLGIDWAFDK
jgi:hypothetical protein